MERPPAVLMQAVAELPTDLRPTTQPTAAADAIAILKAALREMGKRGDALPTTGALARALVKYPTVLDSVGI